MTKILNQNKINYLIVHCSDTKKNLTVQDIHIMHLNFGWDGLGYHKIIDQHGEIHNGRPEYWIGAHVKGLNENSLGVCLIGKENFSKAQLKSLKLILNEWKNKYPQAKVLGHRDSIKTKKTCPNFDVIKWYESVENEQ